jgi:hypothetical protein
VVVRPYHLIGVVAAVAVFAAGILLGRTALARDAQTPDRTSAATHETVTVNEIVLTTPDGMLTVSQEQLQAQYDGFQPEASVRTAEANARSAVPAAEAYYTDHGTYAGMTIEALHAIDQGLDPDTVRVAYAKRARYCIEGTDDTEGSVAHYEGPGGVISEGSCPRQS